MPWAAVSSAGLSRSPLCFLASPCYQFTLNSLEHRSLCEFKCYSPFEVDGGQSASLLLVVSLRYNFIFGSVAYNTIGFKKISPPSFKNKQDERANSIYFFFNIVKRVFIFCIKSQDTFSNYFLLSREISRTIFPSCLL